MRTSLLAVLVLLACGHGRTITRDTAEVPVNTDDTRLCLGVVGIDHHGSGALAEVYTCNPPPPDHGEDGLWTIEPIEGGYFFIKNFISSLCLGVQGVDLPRERAMAARVEVIECTGVVGDARLDNQWRFEETQAFSGVYRIHNRVSNLCLGVVGIDSVHRGSAVEIYRCEPWETDSVRDTFWHEELGPAGTTTVKFKNQVAPLNP